MSTAGTHDVTRLLLAWSSGDETALERLVPMVQAELRRLARHYMRGERAGHTLQTSALVNEAYLRLIDAGRIQWRDRSHFFGIAATLMRRVLVDSARARNYQKRGGGAEKVSLDERLLANPEPATDVIAIDAALDALAETDVRKAKVVEMRFFAGMGEKEIASALSVSPETVRRDWRLAKSWLLRWLNEDGIHGN